MPHKEKYFIPNRFICFYSILKEYYIMIYSYFFFDYAYEDCYHQYVSQNVKGTSKEDRKNTTSL